ncbi:Arsenical-resistance protein ACR3 [Azospirillum palustre]
MLHDNREGTVVSKPDGGRTGGRYSYRSSPSAICTTKSFSMALLGTLFIGHLFAPLLPQDQISSYIADLILLAAAPCTAMVFAWRCVSALPDPRRRDRVGGRSGSVAQPRAGPERNEGRRYGSGRPSVIMVAGARNHRELRLPPIDV